MSSESLINIQFTYCVQGVYICSEIFIFVHFHKDYSQENYWKFVHFLLNLYNGCYSAHWTLLNTLLLIPKQQKSNICNFLGLCGIPQRGLHNVFENLKLCVVFLFLSFHKPMLISMLYELKGFENIVYHLFQWSDLCYKSNKITILEERLIGGGKAFAETLCRNKVKTLRNFLNLLCSTLEDVNYFRKKLHLRYLTGFLIYLCKVVRV